MRRISLKLFIIAVITVFASVAYAHEYKHQIHAHRGGRAEFDENTLSAFKGSYERGIRGYETDVRLSKDGVFVILHDGDLKRMAGIDKKIEEMTAEEICAVKTQKGNPILFLDELLDYFSDKPGLYVEFEMKTDAQRYPQPLLEEYCRKLHDKVIAKKQATSTYLFTSFDKRPLQYLKANYSDSDLMLISGSHCSDSLVQVVLDMGLHRLACTMQGSSRDEVKRAHDKGLIVCGWPGYSKEDYMLGVSLDFDHICTDIPVELNDWINRQPEYARNRDCRVRDYVTPTRIVWQNAENGAEIRDVENLLKEGIGQSILGSEGVCRMISTKNGHPSILLDFGKELHGGLQIITGQMNNQKPKRIHVRFGESASEAMYGADGVDGATNEHAMRDFDMLLPWLGVAEVGNTGFRFVRIDFLDDNMELQLKEVRAIFLHQDIQQIGSFRCNDERLNKIWETGAYTVFLNMQQYIWDGIKRDRLVWIGDLHPEVMTVNNVFGYNDIIPTSLELIRDATPVPNWMNGISSYSLWWIMINRDWYYYQGDLDFLKKQQPYLTQLFNYLFTKVDGKGQEHLDGNRFLDWPSSENRQGVNAGLQALMTITMDNGNEMFTILGDNAMAEKCKSIAAKMRKIHPEHNDSKQGAALMALAGLMNAEKANNEVLSVGGSKNFSTFYGYYMLRAMAKAGDYTNALNRIREYWGAMLDLGATTFWEDFNMDWTKNAARIDELVPDGKVDVHRTYGNYCYKNYRHSLCHGWASGPTSWLSEYVLGVSVVEPGCKIVKIEPHLGDLQWVEGTFPTPKGVIKIRHEKQADGTVKSEIEAPEGVKVESKK